MEVRRKTSAEIVLLSECCLSAPVVLFRGATLIFVLNHFDIQMKQGTAV